MPDLRFLIVDADPGVVGAPNPDYGRPFALDPANATGIPIPAFRSGPVTPAIGQTAGEAFLNTTSDQAFVWDGARWQPIAPAAITVYPTDADVLNDLVAAQGTYGSARDTGNLYIKNATGWRFIGIRSYVDMATLLADPAADGSIGVAMAEQSIWLRIGGQWIPQSPILYTTEAILLAATPPDGTIGIAEDTGLIYCRMNGAWRRSNSPTITVAQTAPATPAVGDLHFDDATGTGRVWSGTQWMSMNAEPIGEVKYFAGQAASVPPNFLVCDGSAIPAQFPALIALIGPNTPNLMNQFIRGGAPEANFISHQDTTRAPRTAFTVSNPGNHTHGIQVHGHNWDQTVNGTLPGGGYNYKGEGSTLGAGGHTHTISGGDAETAPKHILLLPIIRAA